MNGENGGSEAASNGQAYENWKAKTENTPTPNEEQAQKILESNQRRSANEVKVQSQMEKSPHGMWDRVRGFFSKKKDYQEMQDMQEMNAKSDAYWKDISDRKQKSLHATEGQSAFVRPALGEYDRIKESGSQTQEAKPADTNLSEEKGMDQGGGVNTETTPLGDTDPYKDVIMPGTGEENSEKPNDSQENKSVLVDILESRKAEENYKKAFDIASKEQDKIEENQRYQNLVDLVSREQSKLEQQDSE